MTTISGDEYFAERKRDPRFMLWYKTASECHALQRSLIDSRKKSGLTKKDVAKALGWKVKAVRKFEEGGKGIDDLYTVMGYASVLGIHLIPGNAEGELALLRAKLEYSGEISE